MNSSGVNDDQLEQYGQLGSAKGWKNPIITDDNYIEKRKYTFCLIKLCRSNKI